MKTVKQTADACGVSSQTVRNWLSLPEFKGREKHQGKRIVLPDDLADALLAYSERVRTERTAPTSSKDSQIELLSKQLEEKDRQIATLQELLRNEQVLHKSTQDRASRLEAQIKALEAPKSSTGENIKPEQNGPADASESPQSEKRSFFRRLFGG